MPAFAVAGRAERTQARSENAYRRIKLEPGHDFHSTDKETYRGFNAKQICVTSDCACVCVLWLLQAQMRSELIARFAKGNVAGASGKAMNSSLN